MKLLLLVGAPGSGKSTFAKYLLRTEENWVRVCRDDFRALQFAVGNMLPEQEALITRIMDAAIDAALRSRHNVVVDATHTRQTFIEHLLGMFGGKADIAFKLFDTDLETLKTRCAARYAATGKFIPDRVIEKYVNELNHLKQAFDFADRPKSFARPMVVYRPQSPELPSALICDLDGTLALLNGRNPYDASACAEDALNEPVARVLKNYHGLGYRILLVSGREETYRPQTELFLGRYGVPYDALWMRGRKDYRKDSLVKKEIFRQCIDGQYRVEFVLDDRDQVVELWRKELRLPCFQVAYGDF